MPSRCAYPGCDRQLSGMSTTGLCRTHNHAEGLCRCVQCAGLAGKGKPAVRRAEEKPAARPAPAPRPKPLAVRKGMVPIRHRYGVAITATSYRAIRDHAARVGLTVDDMIDAVLTRAVDVDGLDTLFPIEVAE